jgi:GT2 family glycosyltransferase
MKITVIILNWNRPEDTIKAAESVLAQDYPDLGILIWDNNSTRDVQNMLTARIGDHPKVRLVFAELNYGVAGGRNRAFRISDGDIVFFLDSDAVIETPNALSMVAQRMTEDPGLGAISFEIKRSDGRTAT